MNLMANITANRLILLIIALLYASLSIAQGTDSLEMKQDTVSIAIIDTSSLINHNHVDSSSSVDTITTSQKTIIKDSNVDSLSVLYFKGDIQNLKLNRLYYIDTNTYNFQKFDPLYENNRMYSTLSNIGQASNNLVFSPTLTTSYNTKLLTFTNYMYHNEKVKYYKQYVPYSELHYVLAANREQNFNVVFNRSLFTGFTFGLDFALNYSPSASSPYKRNGINEQRVFFTSQYYTKDKRYGIIANFLHNRLDVEENGGIKYDSLFEQNLESDRRIIPVNLNNAKNFIKQSGFFIEQYFNIQKPKSANNNSYGKIDPGSVSYSFRFKRNRYLYTDDESDTTFYYNHNNMYDSTTFDSLTQIQYENIIKWSNIGYNDNPEDKIFFVFAGVKHNHIEQILPYDSIKSTINQLTTFGGVAFNFGRSFHLSGDINYVFGDYNQGDFSVNAMLRQYLGTESKNFGSLNFSLNLINRSPNWYFANYQSNFYKWNNSLNKEKYLVLSGSYNIKQFKAGLKFFTIDNYTYLNDSIRPQQLSKTETMMQIFAEGTIPIKKFGINTRVVYQTTSQPNVIRTPQITGVMDIYFRTHIFKKAAVLQTGFQLMYFSEYYADAYMPELRMFYIQNNQKIGNYPYLDVYLTLMVKRVRIFVKMSHLNSYLGDYRYYMAPSYPARDARFSFGASWRFHD
jgi:hypothetical protein